MECHRQLATWMGRRSVAISQKQDYQTNADVSNDGLSCRHLWFSYCSRGAGGFSLHPSLSTGIPRHFQDQLLMCPNIQFRAGEVSRLSLPHRGPHEIYTARTGLRLPMSKISERLPLSCVPLPANAGGTCTSRYCRGALLANNFAVRGSKL